MLLYPAYPHISPAGQYVRAGDLFGGRKESFPQLGTPVALSASEGYTPQAPRYPSSAGAPFVFALANPHPLFQ